VCSSDLRREDAGEQDHQPDGDQPAEEGGTDLEAPELLLTPAFAFLVAALRGDGRRALTGRDVACRLVYALTGRLVGPLLGLLALLFVVWSSQAHHSLLFHPRAARVCVPANVRSNRPRAVACEKRWPPRERRTARAGRRGDGRPWPSRASRRPRRSAGEVMSTL